MYLKNKTSYWETHDERKVRIIDDQEILSAYKNSC